MRLSAVRQQCRHRAARTSTECLMPRNDRTVGQVVLCCRVPEQTSDTEAARWQAEAARRGIPVTWVVTPEQASQWFETSGAQQPLAVRIGDPLAAEPMERAEIRGSLHASGGQVSAAVLEGDQPLEHRELFLEAGIDIVASSRLHRANRGSRRPAPHGWECRCLLWGLWEAAFTAPRRRLFGLVAESRPQRGRLTLLQTGCRHGEPADVGFARLRQTLSQVQAGLGRGGVEASLLSELPSLLQGGHTTADRGSILAAA